jgi:hypothetical protein
MTHSFSEEKVGLGSHSFQKCLMCSVAHAKTAPAMRGSAMQSVRCNGGAVDVSNHRPKNNGAASSRENHCSTLQGTWMPTARSTTSTSPSQAPDTAATTKIGMLAFTGVPGATDVPPSSARRVERYR